MLHNLPYEPISILGEVYGAQHTCIHEIYNKYMHHTNLSYQAMKVGEVTPAAVRRAVYSVGWYTVRGGSQRHQWRRVRIGFSRSLVYLSTNNL